MREWGGGKDGRDGEKLGEVGVPYLLASLAMSCIKLRGLLYKLAILPPYSIIKEEGSEKSK